MRKLLGIVLALGVSFPLFAVPQLETVGQGSYRYLFWQLYDARLATRDGRYVDYQQSSPLLLELTYKRKISRDQFIEATVDEWKKLKQSTPEQQADWAEQLKTLWRDVKEGDRLAAVLLADSSVEFYFNGTKTGVVEDNIFGPAFFNIWLHNDTSAPKLREQLTGLGSE
ncbi:chalcone isomerase family protein [Alishewanella sp. 16-MA]|uniref:Chalcone isomerase family protein n=1 Tax=Alishewanella maricola TaxID=2795740 RepID=A0ABS8C0G5_9ALTE|nr:MULTISPECIES: chalcone isomerase family protein [Alishewanella]MDP4945168.1 chalcone isomerase family protein [Alishewanella sp.]MDP5206046.1 chalcone isomerase family protein [Alishewanella sp. SMS9]MCB5225804.1 chalcone isomerase family protein [Alishewanella maricola]MDP5036422.1 chalcone isomerase family protein [Alishewanella sp.]MDP5187625.1 chalcone isomerase family protein [Alishewanella sp.]